MTLEPVDIIFQVIAFLFAISVHESAHAWMANLRGDPTARMLGRITLNPIKHIDLFGTLILPAVAMLAHLPVLGWAKPTPVDPRNFKNPPLDGSHVVRHLLPAGARRIYDTVGTFGLLLLVFWGGRFLSGLINPVFAFFIGILLRI